MSERLLRLIYIPILHAREEVVDHKTAVLSGKGENRVTSSGVDAGQPALDEMWAGIAAKMDWLRKGAKLEGTEDIDLLIKEYDLLNVFLMNNSGADLSPILPTPAIAGFAKAGAPGAKGEQSTALTEYKTKSKELLEIRDQFIFKRIQSTIQNGEIPLVLMGVMHRLDKLLEKDFLISYIIYRLPFHSVDAIYNT